MLKSRSKESWRLQVRYGERTESMSPPTCVIILLNLKTIFDFMLSATAVGNSVHFAFISPKLYANKGKEEK
jgi:hypothetical protein